jgi:hypothetical protein
VKAEASDGSAVGGARFRAQPQPEARCQPRPTIALPGKASVSMVDKNAFEMDEQQAPSSGVPLPHESGSPHAYRRRGVYLRLGREPAVRSARLRSAALREEEHAERTPLFVQSHP